ncbi:hypothetical protein [Komagataeibacter europaeus]|uniref:hypothetical protein n=1 Tax=Komagataeibacter europaeus TaxID=33995 RepID=UPI0012DF3ABC|nr:hypothetical protein [Komagataeibacter europaeus]
MPRKPFLTRKPYKPIDKTCGMTHVSSMKKDIDNHPRFCSFVEKNWGLGRPFEADDILNCAHDLGGASDVYVVAKWTTANSPGLSVVNFLKRVCGETIGNYRIVPVTGMKPVRRKYFVVIRPIGKLEHCQEWLHHEETYEERREKELAKYYGLLVGMFGKHIPFTTRDILKMYNAKKSIEDDAFTEITENLAGKRGENGPEISLRSLGRHFMSVPRPNASSPTMERCGMASGGIAKWHLV